MVQQTPKNFYFEITEQISNSSQNNWTFTGPEVSATAPCILVAPPCLQHTFILVTAHYAFIIFVHDDDVSSLASWLPVLWECTCLRICSLVRLEGVLQQSAHQAREHHLQAAWLGAGSHEELAERLMHTGPLLGPQLWVLFTDAIHCPQALLQPRLIYAIQVDQMLSQGTQQHHLDTPNCILS